MKVLYVARLFSGIESSLIVQEWRPTGVPAVFKMIEAIERGNNDLRLVFTCKDYEEQWKEKIDRTLKVKGLNTKITVLSGSKGFYSKLIKIRGLIREIRQTYGIRRICREFQPDILYIDRVNFIPAAFFARYSGIPVVLRLMGVGTPFLKEILSDNRKKLINKIARWAYRSPFAFVICTQDGSGAESWLATLINRSIPRKLLINGVDVEKPSCLIDQRLAGLPEDRTTVFFVGRLEKLKGCEEFLWAFLIANGNAKKQLHAVIVGDGSLDGSLWEIVEKNSAREHVTFIKELPHKQIIYANLRADIYVSLNRGGNLSNANLEAMKTGCCMIFPASQPDHDIDIITDKLIPLDAAIRISDPDNIQALADAILLLHRNPKKRLELGVKMKKAAEKFIPSWEERISDEIEILQCVASGREKFRALK